MFHLWILMSLKAKCIEQQRQASFWFYFGNGEFATFGTVEKVGSLGPHPVSLVTSRGKRPVPCPDCPGADHRQFFGSVLPQIWLLTWSSGLATASAAAMLLRKGRKAALSPHQGDPEAQTDLHGEASHGSRQGGAGGGTDQDTAGEEGAVAGGRQPRPQK